MISACFISILQLFNFLLVRHNLFIVAGNPLFDINLRRHPLPRVTIAGGFAKLAKLAQGHLDLHSSRSELDLTRLGALARSLGADAALESRIVAANTGAEALTLCTGAGIPIAEAVAKQARETALAGAGATPIDVLVIGRKGEILAEAGGGT